MQAIRFLLVGLLFYSCEESTYKLEKRAKFLADSLFLTEYQSILKEQDSICTLRKQASIKTMVDSIVDMRKKEIIQLQKGL